MRVLVGLLATVAALAPLGSEAVRVSEAEENVLDGRSESNLRGAASAELKGDFPPIPSIPSFPPVSFPPIPSIPSFPPVSFPPIPSIPSFPPVSFPPIPSIPSFPPVSFPPIPSTISASDVEKCKMQMAALSGSIEECTADELSGLCETDLDPSNFANMTSDDLSEIMDILLPAGASACVDKLREIIIEAFGNMSPPTTEISPPDWETDGNSTWSNGTAVVALNSTAYESCFGELSGELPLYEGCEDSEVVDEISSALCNVSDISSFFGTDDPSQIDTLIAQALPVLETFQDDAQATQCIETIKAQVLQALEP